MAKLRTGILGCGGIANRHAGAIAQVDRLQLVALCDIEEARAQDFNRRYADGKAMVFSDFNEMFEKADLNLVYICLPPFAHTNEVTVAAKAGCHILIEKPIALDMKTANAMVRACKEYKVKSQVGFMNRFGDAVAHVKKLQQTGEAGPAGLMTVRYMCNSLHGPWWRDKSKSGGQIVEQIIHSFDLTRYFLGEPVSVFTHLDNIFHKKVPGFTSEDVSATTIRFDSGAVATVAGTDGAIPGQWINRFELVTQKYTVEFTDSNNAVLHHTAHEYPFTTTMASQKDLFIAETLDLLEAIDKDVPTRCDMADGARTLELVLAASKSGETGEVVKLKHRRK